MKANQTTDRFVCDNWDEPEVNVTSKGSNRAPARKVMSLGNVNIEMPELHDKLVKSLRSGYDVKLRCSEEEEPFVRFIAIVDKNGAMLVQAQALGSFSKATLADKKPRYVRGGQDISEEEAMAKPEPKEKKECKCQSKVDSYVKCPNCHTRIRVGRDSDGELKD